MFGARDQMRQLARAVGQPGGRSSPPPSTTTARANLTGVTADDPPLEFEDVESGSQVHFTREQRRSRRKRPVRARSISTLRLARSELEEGRRLFPDEGSTRPARRAECDGQPRPCPFVSCRYHLYLDVSPRTGSIKLNFPDLEVWELGESCALDVAERGGVTVEHLGSILNITRERVRQLEIQALSRLHDDLTKVE